MMSTVYFISDYHFGHEKVLTFEDNIRAKVLGVTDILAHDELLLERTLCTVNKRDTIWILGDNGNIDTTLRLFTECRGRIRYIPGNHDSPQHIQRLWKYCKVQGISKWKGNWVTHCPVHPNEMYRAGVNIHGHCHSKVIKDNRYVCVSIENTRGYPIRGTDIRDKIYTTGD